VPEKGDLTFLNGGGAVRLNATYAYADLADSSGLAQSVKQEVAANIIRAYVHAAAKTFRSYGGEIRSFDGDRVMSIFVGEDKNAQAVRAALALNWAVDKVINPIMFEMWSDLSQLWRMRHAIGVATGEALIVRGGVFGDSDMISIGGAPNIAAKLSELRPVSPHVGPQYSIYITEEVYGDLPDTVKLGQASFQQRSWGFVGQPAPPSTVDMWDPLGQRRIGGTHVWVRGSTYEWEPSK
jgi:class 3 adenylate cyclase